MRKKIVGIFVMTLLIAATALPVAVSMNKEEIYFEEGSQFLQPTIEWQKSYACEEFDQFRCVKQTDDGGYIAFGEYEESDMTYARLIKVDSLGNEEWTFINHDLNGSGYNDGELMNSVLQTSDGGYLACGFYSYYYQGDEFGVDDFWAPAGFLWKVDSNGNTEWINEIYDGDPPTYMAIFHVLELVDGYIGTGYFGTVTNPEMTEFNFNVGLFKTDLMGNLQWYKTYDFGGYDGGQSLTQTTDGGYYITGATEQPSDNVDGVAMLMLKTDSEGNKQWDKIFDTPEDDYSYIRETCQANDGGFIICGATGSFSHNDLDLIIIKTDSNGNKEWEKTYVTDSVEYLWGMDKTFDGGYVFALVTDYGKFFGNKDDTWIIKTDQDGNAEWKFRIEQEGTQIPIHIDQTADGGFIIAQRTGLPDSRGCGSCLVKISAFENQRPSNPSTPTGPKRGKPDKEYTFSTDTVTDPEGDTIFYQWDWGDGNFSELLESTETTYTWTFEDNFEVRVLAVDEHGGQSEWSDPLAFSTPRNKITNLPNSLFLRLLEKFPLLRTPF